MGVPLPKATIAATANTNLDGTGTIQTIFTAGPFGARVSGAVIKAQETTSAGMLRLYIANGQRWSLLDEVLISARTPAATTKSYAYQWTPEIGDIDLAPNERLGAAPTNAEEFAIHPIGMQLP